MPTVLESDVLLNFGRIGDLRTRPELIQPEVGPRNYPDPGINVSLTEEFGLDFNSTSIGRSLFGDTLSASFNLENSFINGLDWLTEPNFKADRHFDPFTKENIAGYELDALLFVDVQSKNEMAFVKQKLDRERADRATIEQAGALGILALLTAGFIDPMVMIPVGGQAAKAFQAGKILRSGLLTARAGLVGATATETILYFNQLDRRAQDSLLAIGGATFLGGIMGAAFARMSRAVKTKAVAEVEAHLGGKERPGISGGVDPDDLDLEEAFVKGDAEAFVEGNSPAETQVKKVLGLKLSAKFGPLGRLQVSYRDPIARAYSNMLASPVYRTVANIAGKVSRARVIREGGRVSVVGTKGTISLKTNVESVKGVKAGAEVEILSEPTPNSFFVRAEVEESVPAGSVQVEGHPRVVRTNATVGARRLASEADIDAARVSADARITRDLVETDLLDELTEQGFTGTEAGGDFAPPPKFSVIDEVGEIISDHDSLKEARDQANSLFIDEPTTGVLDGKTVTVLSRDGDNLIIRHTKDLRLRKSVVKTIEQEEFVPTVKVGDELTPEQIGEDLAVETRTQQREANLGRAISGMKELYVKYRLRIAGKPNTFANRQALRISDLRRVKEVLGGDPQSYLQFRKAIGRAMQEGDKHGTIDEITEAAQLWRNEIFDPLAERAIEAKLLAGIIPKERTSSYLSRVYNIELLIADGVGPNSRWDRALRPWLRQTEKGLNEEEITSVIEGIRDSITQVPSGRMQYGESKISNVTAFQKRVLDAPDEVIREFLETDIEVVGSLYSRTVTPDVELAITFGDVEMTRVFEDLGRSFKIRKAALGKRTDLTDKQRAKANTAMDDEFGHIDEDMKALRDRLRGTYAMPDRPDHTGWRWVRGARALNLLAQGGGFAISSIPDIMRPVMVHGVIATFRDGVVPFTRSFVGDSSFRKMALDELRDSAIGWEMILDSRALSMFDIGQEHIGRGTKGEQMLHGAASRMSQWSMLSQWNRAAKQYSGIITQARMLRGMEAVSKGTASKKEIANLAFYGIDEEAAVRMFGHFKKHGQRERGFFMADTAKWGDDLEGDAMLRAHQDAKLMRGATLEEVNRIIVTPGIGDRPLWTSTEWGKSIFQYKSFALAATNRVMISGLQQGDMAAASGTLLSVGMGMAVAGIKATQAGKFDELDDWSLATWVGEGVDRSGLIGIFSDFNAMLEKMDIGYSRWTGGPSSSRYAARNALSSFLGPTFGLAQTGSELLRQVGQLEFSQADVNKIRRVIPYQNIFWARNLFDAFESGVNESLNVPRRSR